MFSKVERGQLHELTLEVREVLKTFKVEELIGLPKSHEKACFLVKKSLM